MTEACDVPCGAMVRAVNWWTEPETAGLNPMDPDNWELDNWGSTVHVYTPMFFRHASIFSQFVNNPTKNMS